jgi:hypothetical protein
MMGVVLLCYWCWYWCWCWGLCCNDASGSPCAHTISSSATHWTNFQRSRQLQRRRTRNPPKSNIPPDNLSTCLESAGTLLSPQVDSERGRLLTVRSRGSTSGNKLKMTLGLPVYV